MVRSYILLLFCVTCWGSNFVFGSILIHEFPPLLLSAIRLSATSLTLFIYVRLAKKLGNVVRRDFMLLIPLGIIGTLCNQAAFFTGLQTVDATTASLILSLAPITVAVLAAVFLKEALTKQMVAGSVTAIVGIFFVVGKSENMQLSIGLLFIFLAMLTFAISIIFMRKLTERIDPFTATVYSTLIGSGMVIPVAVIKEPLSQVSPHLWAWALLLGTAVIMQGVCTLIWNVQLTKVGAGKAAVFLNLQPFAAMLVGFLLLGTPITWVQAVGSLLIVGGVIVATVQRRNKADGLTKPLGKAQSLSKS
ncbi:DMT family transporter [Paenibacillus xerothermodurans]|uniref:DMT family transporter n=1 Tax=Paenibacillus xerothermodurans TaxID=1977292 RepID=A0A2W1N695_PAEXE|nr:DMT family transporter [Paenibacillus xerothermodurans]PZE20169.1 DMT family transporter [Paenibacillus xerothermodurans]